MRRTELLLAGIILPLLLLVPIWLTTSTPAYETGVHWDELYYAAMARRDVAPPHLCRKAPWCWRVLTPFQASLIPFHERAVTGVITDFKVLGFASNWVSLVALYALLRKLRREPLACVIGVVAYAGVHWTVKFSCRAPTYVDFQTLTFMLAILYFMVARRYWVTVPLLVLAALQKETALILIPVVVTHRWCERRRFTALDWSWLAGLVVLPLAALAVVRAIIEPVNDYSATGAIWKVLGEQLPDPRFWPRFLVAVFSGLGILPLALVSRLGAVWRCLRENPAWLVYLAGSVLLLFGGVDKARLFVPMTPAAVVLMVGVLEPTLRERKPAALAWVGLTLLLHAYLGHHFEPMGSPGAALARLAPIHATTSITPSLVRIAAVTVVWATATVALRKPWAARPGTT